MVEGDSGDFTECEIFLLLLVPKEQLIYLLWDVLLFNCWPDFCSFLFRVKYQKELCSLPFFSLCDYIIYKIFSVEVLEWIGSVCAVTSWNFYSGLKISLVSISDGLFLNFCTDIYHNSASCDFLKKFEILNEVKIRVISSANETQFCEVIWIHSSWITLEVETELYGPSRVELSIWFFVLTAVLLLENKNQWLETGWLKLVLLACMLSLVA